jgi:cytochrome b561
MQWINDKQSYGWLTIALHWITVVAVVTMLYLGFSADAAQDAGDREARAALMRLHVSIGATFFLILLARVVSSYAQPRPAPAEQAPIFQLLAFGTHQLLLLGILIQIVSGPLAVWSGGNPIRVFDLFAIPSPFAERNEGVHEFAEVMHAIGRWMLIVFIGLHVLGVAKHMFIDRDGVLERMLAPKKAR